MDKERVKLFPDELPAGKKFKIKRIKSKRRSRAVFSLFLCILIFASGVIFSEAYRNGNITFPDFFGDKNTSQNGANTPQSNDKKYDINTIYDFDYGLIKDGDLAVIPLDISLSEYGDTYIYNDTSFEPDLKSLLEKKNYLPAMTYTEDPVVLIVHTHTSEAYSEEGKISYTEDEEYARSYDEAENVVAVGKIIAEILTQNGIRTIHATESHDETYKDSYSRSAETIRSYLEQYPSIKYVFDIHRDSIIKSNGDIVRPVTVVDGQAVAQIMCVVGTNQAGGEDFDWQNNLALALSLRSSLNEKYSNLVRGTCLRPSAYNQHLAPVSLLLEIGAGGNSLAEAQNAAKLLAYQLVEIIGGGG